MAPAVAKDKDECAEYPGERQACEGAHDRDPKSLPRASEPHSPARIPLRTTTG